MRCALFCLAVAGCQCAPQTQITDLVVEATYPGASIAEVSEQVLLPLEVELSHIEGLTHMAAIAEPEKGRLYLRFEGVGDGLAVLQGSRERLGTVHEALPDSVDGLRVWEQRPRTIWVRATDAAEATRTVGELARSGVGAELVTNPTPRRVWTVQPGALRREVVQVDAVVSAVDAALGAGLPVDAELPIPTLRGAEFATTLGQIATHQLEPGPSQAWLDGQPAAVVAVQGDRPLDGWQRPVAAVDGDWCAHFEGLGTERADAQGLWVRQGAGWSVRGLTSTGGVEARPAAQVWRCDGAVQTRLALVANTDAVDLQVAMLGLRQQPGVRATVPVAVAERSPEITVQIVPEKVASLGLTVSDVTGALAWSGRPRPGDPFVVLRLPERDLEQLSQLPIVGSVSGQMVPLSAVATLSLVAPAPPRVRVDGRDALLLDVVLDGDASLDRWSAPADVDVVLLNGFGPEWVGR